MKNKILISLRIAINIIIVASIGLTKVLNKKTKLIGIWRYSVRETITFNDNNTINIDNIGPLVDLELLGVLNYKISNNQITFNSNSVSETLNYSFPDSDKLVLINDADSSITLTKL